MTNKCWEIHLTFLTKVAIGIFVLMVVEVTWFVSQRINTVESHSVHTEYIDFLLDLWMQSPTFNDAIYLSDVDRIRDASEYILTSVVQQFPNYSVCLTMDVKITGRDYMMESFSTCGKDDTTASLLHKRSANITNEENKPIIVDGVNLGRISWTSVGTDNQILRDYTFSAIIIGQMIVFAGLLYQLRQRRYISRTLNQEVVVGIDEINDCEKVAEAYQKRLNNIDHILKHNRHFNPQKSGELLYAVIAKSKTSTRAVRAVFRSGVVILNRTTLPQVAESFWPELKRANRGALLNFDAITEYASSHHLCREDKKNMVLTVEVKHKTEVVKDQLKITMSGVIPEHLSNDTGRSRIVLVDSAEQEPTKA